MRRFGSLVAAWCVLWSANAFGALSGPTRVTIDADGVLLVNGSKVFPIALTMAPAAEAKSPDGRNALVALHADGISFIRSGPTKGAWDNAAVEAEVRYEEAAARAGIYCMPFLRELGSAAPKQQGRAEALRKLVDRLKNNPGLGVWKGADEPEWGKLPVESLGRARRTIHEADPNHPIWIVQAPRGTIETLRPYDPTYDILGCDIYPISYPPGTHSLKPNKEMSMVGDYTQEMRAIAGPKPVWMTLQIAWSGVVKPGKTLRMPTFPQQRFMTYQAIINGARGLVYFGGNLPQAWTPRDTELGWNWSFWERVLGPVIAEIGPHGPLAQALVAPDSKVKLAVEGGSGIEFLVRETGNDVYVLACKREGETVHVKFTGLPALNSTGEVLFESPRTVTVESGAFSDWFAPFDVHVYKFRRK
ncbi:MAG TPA: hypothetical protein VGI81_10910 [Tepidisphaeraceae bacterium]|jgi:hypothetical protein